MEEGKGGIGDKFLVKDKVCAKVKNKCRVVRQPRERHDRVRSIE